MSTVKYTNAQIHKRKGRINLAKLQAATDAQIARWQQEDGVDESALGPVRAVPPQTDVRALRKRLGLSQDEFAHRFMLSPKTVRDWEQHRREPSDAARVLLLTIARDPRTIAKLLQTHEIGKTTMPSKRASRVRS